MYYCKSRFYVPKWRRWLSSDSIDYLEHENITCLNLFAYCNNNPVMYVDPTGDFAISILALLIGAGVGAVYMLSKGNGPRIGHNHYEHKQFRQLCRKHNLTKTEGEKLHRYISYQNYTYHEIEELIFELFGK